MGNANISIDHLKDETQFVEQALSSMDKKTIVTGASNEPTESSNSSEEIRMAQGHAEDIKENKVDPKVNGMDSWVVIISLSIGTFLGISWLFSKEDDNKVCSVGNEFIEDTRDSSDVNEDVTVVTQMHPLEEPKNIRESNNQGKLELADTEETIENRIAVDLCKQVFVDEDEVLSFDCSEKTNFDEDDLLEGE